MTSDPISSVAAVLAIFVGAAIAQAVAPHLVVIAGGVLGGYFGLMRWRNCNRWEALGYITMCVVGSWLFTGTVVALARSAGVEIEDRWLVAPAAALISGIGHQWLDVGRWGADVIGRIIERRTSV